MRDEFCSSVHIYQLERQGKILMAVSSEGAFGFGWISYSEREIKHRTAVYKLDRKRN